MSLAENFGLAEPKREVQIDLPLRLTPLPLLRWLMALPVLPIRSGCINPICLKYIYNGFNLLKTF